jgi:hypothetical protein
VRRRAAARLRAYGCGAGLIGAAVAREIHVVGREGVAGGGEVLGCGGTEAGLGGDLRRHVGSVVRIHVDAVDVGEMEGRAGRVVRILGVADVAVGKAGCECCVGVEIRVAEGVEGRVGVLRLTDLEDGCTADAVSIYGYNGVLAR